MDKIRCEKNEKSVDLCKEIVYSNTSQWQTATNVIMNFENKIVTIKPVDSLSFIKKQMSTTSTC